MIGCINDGHTSVGKNTPPRKIATRLLRFPTMVADLDVGRNEEMEKPKDSNEKSPIKTTGIAIQLAGIRLNSACSTK
ncbi:hypothetical protein GCM10007377_12660 [Galliscardovia ingluviei]|uniref:Uncharacterized protein n=1 Tax=Galliscardovia ingluviei TaxID=1769422 RepID=A0A8J3AQA3_9BIFI|nr:hypothetical protein GCM10007377_12660 [Galliscardovia ingluviei]